MQEGPLPHLFQLANSMFAELGAEINAWVDANYEQLLSCGGNLGLPNTFPLFNCITSCIRDCLQWDHATSSAAQSSKTYELLPSAVNLGQVWHDVTDNPAFVQTILETYRRCRWLPHNSLPGSLREIMVCLASLEASSFRTEQSRVGFAKQLLEGVLMMYRHAMIFLDRQNSGQIAQLWFSLSDSSELAVAVDSELEFFSRVFVALYSNLEIQNLNLGDAQQYLLETASSLGSLLLEEICTSCEAYSIMFSRSRNLQISQQLISSTNHVLTTGAWRIHADECDFLVEKLQNRREILFSSFDIIVHLLNKLIDISSYGQSGGHDTAVFNLKVLSSILSNISFQLFEKAYLLHLHVGELTIRSGEDDDNPFEDPTALSDHLIGLCALGRLEWQRSSRIIVKELHSTFKNVDILMQSGKTSAENDIDVAVFNERLWWTVSFASYCLADEADGEYPLVPASLLNCSVQEYNRQTVDSTCLLSASLLYVMDSIFEFMAKYPHQELFSPTLSKVLLWLGNRWSRTYIFPDPDFYSDVSVSFLQLYWTHSSPQEHLSISQSFIQAFVEASGLPVEPFLSATSACSSLCAMAVTSFYRLQEDSEAIENSIKLLKTLANNSRIVSTLSQQPDWLAFVFSYIQYVGRLSKLNIDVPQANFENVRAALKHVLPEQISISPCHHEGICQAILGICGTISSSDVSKRYCQYLLENCEKLATQIAQSSTLESDIQTGATNTLVRIILRQVSGICTGDVMSIGDLLIKCCLSGISAATRSIYAMKGASEVTTVSLDVTLSVLKRQLPLASGEYAQYLVKRSVETIEAFSKFHSGSSELAGKYQGDDEVVDNFSFVLKIIGEVAQNDTMDTFSSGPCTEAVLYGLQIVLPLVTEDVLQHPDICTTFMELVIYSVQNHSKMAISLSTRAVSKLMKSLKYGIDHQFANVSFKSIEALNSFMDLLMKRNATEESNWFATHRQNDPQILSQMVPLLLRLALRPQTSSVLLNPLASSVLRLILCEPEATQQCFQQLIDNCEENSKQNVSKVVGDLFTVSKNVTIPLRRPAVEKFREAFQSFITQAKGVVNV